MNRMHDITGSLEEAIAGKRLPAGIRLLLQSASALYGGSLALRNACYDLFPRLSGSAPRPVISIGGVRAGGSGKTPVAALVGGYLLSRGIDVAFLSRGYRRTDSGNRMVRPGETVPWTTIGDEPALLHNRLPQSWLGIGADRRTTAALLAPHLPGRSVYILDDGFQHRALRRDLDIVCLHDSFLSDRLLPAGFLRERLSSLSRANVALLIGLRSNEDALRRGRDHLAGRFPHLQTAILFQEPGCWINARDGARLSRPPLAKPLLICGIARPSRFLTMVRNAGIAPAAEIVFSDHHPYAESDFSSEPEGVKNGIITTEKDAVRLRSIAVVPIEKMWYLTIELCFGDAADEAALHGRIEKAVSFSSIPASHNGA
jgi:tetraacyldisaccharide 4'-kinase